METPVPLFSDEYVASQLLSLSDMAAVSAAQHWVQPGDAAGCVLLVCQSQASCAAVRSKMKRVPLSYMEVTLDQLAAHPAAGGEAAMFCVRGVAEARACEVEMRMWQSRGGVSVVVVTSAHASTFDAVCRACDRAAVSDVLSLEELDMMQQHLAFLRSRPALPAGTPATRPVVAVQAPMAALVVQNMLRKCVIPFDVSATDEAGVRLVLVDADVEWSQKSLALVADPRHTVVAVTMLSAEAHDRLAAAYQRCRGVAHAMVGVHSSALLASKLAFLNPQLVPRTPQLAPGQRGSGPATSGTKEARVQRRLAAEGPMVKWNKVLLGRLAYHYSSMGGVEEDSNVELTRRMNQDEVVRSELLGMGLVELTKKQVTSRRQNSRLGYIKVNKKKQLPRGV